MLFYITLFICSLKPRNPALTDVISLSCQLALAIQCSHLLRLGWPPGIYMGSEIQTQVLCLCTKAYLVPQANPFLLQSQGHWRSHRLGVLCLSPQIQWGKGRYITRFYLCSPAPPPVAPALSEPASPASTVPPLPTVSRHTVSGAPRNSRLTL